MPAAPANGWKHWAATTPDALFLAQRDADGEWQRLSYAEVHQRVLNIATWMLGQHLSAERPVVMLSDNSIEHAPC
ncbi:MAG: AMP-binding protein [Thiolinea sp.]